MPRYPLLLVPDAPDTLRYTSTLSGRDRHTNPARNRVQHAGRLLRQVETAQQQQPAGRQIGNGFYQPTDLNLVFESEPNFELAFESLEMARSGIELLAVHDTNNNRQLATVRIPDGKLPLFVRKLEAYRDNDPNQPAPDGQKRPQTHRRMAESISNIRRASLQEFWTDPADTFPEPNQTIAWEVWLRKRRGTETEPTQTLINSAADFGFEVISEPLTFIDRTVILVRGTPEQISLGTEFLGVIAELRTAKSTPSFLDGLDADDQHEWIANLANRLQLPDGNSPIIGLLDNGVNRQHPLLARVIQADQLHTYKPAWGFNDTGPEPHGTSMSGLALYGDLSPLLEGNQQIILTHRLESFKLIHVPDPHRPELFGVVTQEGVYRLEVTPARRVYCMAITTRDDLDRGRPSSWSSAVDALAMGDDPESTRLIIVAAGNTLSENRTHYPADNETSSVQDPAQSWNALTVGAFTDKVDIDRQEYPGHTPLAAAGDLAPASTTSLIWPRDARWPFKPDIVMEGGNMARPAPGGDPSYLPDLSLLSTSEKFALGHRPLRLMYDTSAATALAARLAAALMAQYPEFTPETIRALLVHSARWTPAMLNRSGGNHVNLLRTFGYGTPDTNALFSCASNELTLIAQSTLQPFFKDGSVKTSDLNLHALPWPAEALQELPVDTIVKLRVTLSYFIEPSPGERGWDKKYGYASHGLRFAVQRPLETVEQFRQRINAFGRDDDFDKDDNLDDVGNWQFGQRTPTNGSIHSNVWTGTAAELADRSHIAVYPTMGWWKNRPGEKRYDRSVRYSLVVTIETPDINTDIYTPVANRIGVAAPVPIEINIE